MTFEVYSGPFAVGKAYCLDLDYASYIAIGL